MGSVQRLSALIEWTLSPLSSGLRTGRPSIACFLTEKYRKREVSIESQVFGLKSKTFGSIKWTTVRVWGQVWLWRTVFMCFWAEKGGPAPKVSEFSGKKWSEKDVLRSPRHSLCRPLRVGNSPTSTSTATSFAYPSLWSRVWSHSSPSVWGQTSRGHWNQSMFWLFKTYDNHIWRLIDP